VKACKILLTVLVFLVILFVIFTNQKTLTTSLEFNYYDFGFQPHTVEIPVLSLLLFAFALGALLVGLKGFADQQQLKHRLRRLNRELERSTEEMLDLKEQAARVVNQPAPAPPPEEVPPPGDDEEEHQQPPEATARWRP